MEFKEQRAIYLQIADYICEKILRKEWQAKEKIPSVRELAIDLEVNPNTVVKTYGYLENKKIIIKQRGIGYFVAQDGYEKVLTLKKEKFLKQEMPLFLNTMKLLNLKLEDLHENQ
jgi:DNA-binding transcriptional regulator YhcF (GntR family)